MWEKFINIERTIISLIDELLGFLSENFGLFYDSEDQLTFIKETHAERYDSFIQHLEDLTKEEGIILKDLEEHQQSVFQQMANFEKAY